MPIPDAGQAVVSRDKVVHYLLNPEHPDGSSKAAWFASLGYERDEWQILANDLLKIALDCKQFVAEPSAFGVKYKVRGIVGRPNHRPGDVITVWIVEGNDPPRLVTAYPDD